ncbi:hypothetical protein ABID23_000716 [Bartonella silvatica]|uniref:Integrase DNA-binding domain-containing protein n=1 Tax=Bartonella silvatica TaxID=357760 RepID=A0ABV2HGF4_9HYPH
MLLHKRKDGSAGWIYRYTLHEHRREMGLDALRDVSLKQTRECVNQWRSVLHGDHNPIKESEKQKREAMRNLHYLKDTALDTFESRKAELAELKVTVKMGTGFYLYTFIFSPNEAVYPFLRGHKQKYVI